MNKGFSVVKVLALGAFLVIAFISGYVLKKLPSDNLVVCPADVTLCTDGSYVSRTGPDCAFSPCPMADKIVVDSPVAFDEIESPLKISGKAAGWYFEASFPVKILDGNGTVLGAGPATAESDWMTADFVPFNAVIPFSEPGTQEGVILLQADNPSGLPENAEEIRLPIRFKSVNSEAKQKISLYYYDAEKDKDTEGNIMCSEAGLVAVEREMPVTMSPIKDAINLLLKGRQNLTAQDLARGIDTEYPLDGFSLAEANLKSDGTLLLRFNDPQNRSVGGACRVGILWSQIAKTARQFSNVRTVEFLPEELFQP